MLHNNGSVYNQIFFYLWAMCVCVCGEGGGRENAHVARIDWF